MLLLAPWCLLPMLCLLPLPLLCLTLSLLTLVMSLEDVC